MKHQSLRFDVAHMIRVYNKVAEFHWMCLNDKKKRWKFLSLNWWVIDIQLVIQMPEVLPRPALNWRPAKQFYHKQFLLIVPSVFYLKFCKIWFWNNQHIRDKLYSILFMFPTTVNTGCTEELRWRAKRHLGPLFDYNCPSIVPNSSSHPPFSHAFVNFNRAGG